MHRPPLTMWFLGCGLLMSIPGCLLIKEIEWCLLKTGVINTKDLPPFAGNEQGTFTEHLLNIWHWDVFIGLFGLASLPMTAAGILLLKRAGKHQNLVSVEANGATNEHAIGRKLTEYS